MFQILNRFRASGAGWGGMVFLILFVSTFALWRFTESASNEHARARFDLDAENITQTIETRLRNYEQILVAGTALFAASDDVSREQWHAYVTKLDVQRRFPGVQGIGFSKRLFNSEVDEHIRQVRREGFPAYAVHPEYERSQYASVIFLEPFDFRNQRAFGYDMTTEPVRREAMERSRDTGGAALSGKVVLVQETETDIQNGFLMYLPVYRSDAAVETPEDRQRAFLGHVYSPFRVNDFISGIFGAQPRNIHVDIYDASTADDSALYRDPVTQNQEISASAPEFTRVITRTILGHPWTYRLTSLPGYRQVPLHEEPIIVLIAGLLVTLLASIVAGALAVNRTQTKKMNRHLEADIARHQQFEEQLTMSREKFRVMFDNNPQPMWAFDRTTLAFMMVNDTAVAKYGYSREEFLKMKITDIRPAEDVEGVIDETKRSPSQFKDARVWRHRLRDGRIIHVEIRSAQLVVSGRKVALVVPEDITERKAAEEALRIGQARFQAILDNAPLMITLKDIEGRYIVANRQFQTVYAPNGEQIIGRRPEEILSPSRAEKEAARDAQTLKKRAAVQFEDTEESDGAPQTHLSIHFPVPSDTATVEAIGMVAADITESRKIENQFRHLQKMESIGQLTGGVAHDFNNLLTVIRSNGEDLKSDLAEHSMAWRQADMILQAADRGAALVRQMMAFARKQRLEPKIVDANSMLKPFVGMLRRIIESNISIEFQAAPGELLIKADPGLLETGLLNLCLNARDAMRSGGKLLIETGEAFLSEAYTRDYGDVTPGDYVFLAVSDNGTGMSKDVAERIFEPFFTTKEVGKGTGLGLSMVYGFVKQSGGHATVYSELGKGTTIKIYLPRSEGRAATKSDDVRKVEFQRTGKILFVEDDSLVSDSLTTLLTHLGYTVSTATTAGEAVSILESGEAFDLVFTDVMMPGTMTGIDLAWEIRQRWPHVRILATSGYTRGFLLGESTELPAGVELLSKPYSNNQLMRAIAAAMATAPYTMARSLTADSRG